MAKSEKFLPVFETQAALDAHVAKAKADGAKPRLLRRWQVNAAYVAAPSVAKALQYAWSAEVEGITCRELGGPPPIDTVMAALAHLTEDEKAKLLEALGGKRNGRGKGKQLQLMPTHPDHVELGA